MDIYIFVAIVFSFLGLCFGFWRLVCTLRQKSEELFFWGGAIYFALIPIFFDSLLMASGELRALNDSISSENPSYWTGVDSIVLMHASLFVFLFNFIYWLSARVANSAIHVGVVRPHGGFRFVGSVFLLVVVYVALYFAFEEGVDFIQKQKDDVQTTFSSALAQLVIPLSAVCLFAYGKEKRYYMAFLFAMPLALVSFVGQARAMFFYIPAAIVMLHVVQSDGNVKLKKLGFYLLVLLCMSVAVKVVANEDHGFWYADSKLIFFASNVLRDVSIGDFYFAVDAKENHDNLTTQGKSTLALVLTGIVPPFLGKELFDSKNTVIFSIYQLRFGDYSFGSVHPTLYGCAYFDLGYLGVFLAIFFPFVLRVFKKLYGRFFFSEALVVIVAGFWFVTMRGSPNVAYFRLFYSSILVFILMYVAYAADKAFSGGRKLHAGSK